MSASPTSASLFGAPPTEAPARAAIDALLHPDRTAAHTIEVAIPMRDGVHLAADVHLPAAEHRPAPAVVLGTPYDKSGASEREGALYREAGYALVVFDCRGRGKSEGAWRALVHDGPDGHDVVEWAAAQDWCDGAVGATGLSYAGWITWATAFEHPPHLRAVVSTSAAGRWLQEIPYTWGCFQLYIASWAAMVERRVMDNPTFDLHAALRTLPVGAIEAQIDPGGGQTWHDQLHRDRLDDFWQALRFDDRYDELADLPVLHVTGWHDREDLQGAFHHYEHLTAASPSLDRQWLIVGPWSHVMSRWPGNEYGGAVYDAEANVDMSAVHLRFFDRFLRGADNGVDDEPRLRLFDTGADRWTTPDRWLTGTEHVLHPTAGGRRAYRYDPADPPVYGFDVEGLWEPPLDLAPLLERDDVLTFATEPLTEPLTLHGWSRLHLRAITDGDDTDWFAMVADVGEDGRPLRVAGGCLRASYRASLSAPEPVPPGVPVDYDVEITPALHTFLPGHRVALTVASAEYPWFARSLNRFGPIAAQDEPRVAHNVVVLGPGATRLRLGVPSLTKENP